MISLMSLYHYINVLSYLSLPLPFYDASRGACHGRTFSIIKKRGGSTYGTFDVNRGRFFRASLLRFLVHAERAWVAWTFS